jgi:FkbM family methyltransferase
MTDNRHDFILTLFDTNSELTIFEIGANDGAETIWFSKHFPNSEIHSFEIDERNFNMYLNSINEKNIIFNKLGVSDVDGETLLYLSTDTKWGRLNTSASSIKKPTDLMYQTHNWIEFDETVTAKTIKLDTYVHQKEIDRIDFIWCDIQGAEREMILGAKEALNNTKYLLVEILNLEIYENSLIKLEEFKQILPDFEIVIDWGNDALFKNKKIN